MPLFHPRVLKRHTERSQVNAEHITLLTQWAENLERGVFDVETQSDARFIQRILIDVLGFVGRGDAPNWTLLKNQPIGNGNVDVALGNFTADAVKIIAPLELKGAKTKNLDALYGTKRSPVQQAWDYANDNTGTKWVLVSNYREIRLYAYGKGRKDYETFDLIEVANCEQQYKRFILLLSANNLLGNKTLSLLDESEKVDKDITDKFYREYKEFRVRLIETISKDNPAKDKLDIIRLAQKILDRILFVAFAESRDLLPKKTLLDAFASVNRYNPQPIWKNFVGLFHAINEGNAALGITAYNGGLFADDPGLNELIVSDDLCKGFKKIGEYDFDTEISVDILGHIFEQSISDLEELKAVAEGNAGTLDKKKSKRKTDGVFYTPPYITQYIVEQTVGGWLTERRKEIGFDTLPMLSDDDYESTRQNLKQSRNRKIANQNIDNHIAAWEAYKTALSNIKILDPACGSGAFLIEVFDYLCREGKKINDELTRLHGGQQSIFRWDTHILSNNLYGVDLNRESVEITKLSLWLKTARRNEKLTYLENNIKVGNSLIDDKTVAGDLAFDWNEEFSDIMASSGFDVVVGNPPYGADIDKFVDVYETLYPETSQGFKDIYKYFFHRATGLVKDKGILGFITPNTFLRQPRYADLRRFLLKYKIEQLIDLGEGIFDVVVPTAITILSKKEKSEVLFADLSKSKESDDIKKQLQFTQIDQSVFENTPNNIFVENFRDKRDNEYLLDEILEMKDAGFKYQRINVGMSEKGNNDLAERIFYFGEKQNANDIPMLIGKDINAYYHEQQPKQKLRHDYQSLLKSNEKTYFNKTIMEKKVKLIWRQTAPYFIGTILREPIFFGNTIQAGIVKEEFENRVSYQFLCVLLNSKYLRYLYECHVKETGRVFPQVKLEKLKSLPIVVADDQQPFIELSDKILSLHSELNSQRVRFQHLLSDNLGGVKMPDKRFDEIEEFKDFLNELKKQKRPIPLNEQDEWRDAFYESKGKISALRESIRQTDGEIDRMVYELYGLTPEEIAVVGLTETQK